MKKLKFLEINSNIAPAILSIFAILFIFTSPLWAQVESQGVEPEPIPTLQKEQIEKIEKYVYQQMEGGQIPGMMVVVVQGEHTVYLKGFGFADLENQKEVTPDTLFELASNSKAYTALGVLLLEEQGKLNLDDPVSKYLPWFKVNFRGRNPEITLRQLLYQSSGLPYRTVGYIQPGNSPDSLEKTIKSIVGIELRHRPGEAYHYATINYSILGLVIQTLSSASYEEFMKEKVLTPLGLHHTYLEKNDIITARLATGYKLCMKKPRPYQSPVYRGNVPAGYIMTSGKDLARWLKIHLGAVKSADFNHELIEKSHLPGQKIGNSGMYYAMGWFNAGQGSQIFHSGNNPNFSTSLGLMTHRGYGVGILANINSNYVIDMGKGISSILLGAEAKPSRQDLNRNFDHLSSLILFVSVPLFLLSLVFFLFPFKDIIIRKRMFKARGILGLLGFFAASLLFLGLVYVLWNFPKLVGHPVPWSTVTVWMPGTLTYAALSLLLTGLIIYLNFVCRFFFPRTKGK